MSTATRLPTAAAKSLQAPGASRFLQRKCACGGSASGLTGKCEECSKKKVQGLQTKLQINDPGDVYEQEADRIAEQVLAKPAHPDVSSAPPRIQRFSGQEAGHTAAAPASVDRVLASSGQAARAGASAGHGAALRPGLFGSESACRSRCRAIGAGCRRRRLHSGTQHRVWCRAVRTPDKLRTTPARP